MTTSELIIELQRFPVGTEVFLSKDPEGNMFWTISHLELDDEDDVIVWPGVEA